MPMDTLAAQVLELVRQYGYKHYDEPLQLASGEYSQDFIDAKAALAQGSHLRIACEAILKLAADRGIDFDAVGGLTLGADHFSHGIALVGDKKWFVIRKEAKGRGTNKFVEGATIGPGDRVLLVDDVVTTGGSIQQAFDRVAAEGAQVVMAVTLFDRGEVAAAYFKARSVPYAPLLTYRDLGIPPVGGG
jgi:orotate phosphoribosyltransferase